MAHIRTEAIQAKPDRGEAGRPVDRDQSPDGAAPAAARGLAETALKRRKPLLASDPFQTGGAWAHGPMKGGRAYQAV